MKVEERDMLIDELLDGEISEADFLRLEAELHVDPKARRAYYDRQALHLLLQNEAAEQGMSFPVRAERPAQRTRWVTASNTMALAATIVALLAVGALIWRDSSPRDMATLEEPSASGFGVVASQVDAVWGEKSLSDGALLPSGRLKLKSGAAQLELFSGVNLVIEGEADIELISAMEVAVHRGRVRARVPEPAHGFRLHTPEGEIVDLGTEFGVSVSEEASEVHVIDGEVEWHAEDAPVQKMLQGDGLRQSGGERRSAEAGERFLGIEELSARRRQTQTERRQRALAFRQELGDDPRLLVHYAVGAEVARSRQLPNHAGETSRGAVVGAAPASDRFGRPNAALDFSPTGSRVRLQVPGEHGSLTLLAWVKINSLDRWYNSLFLTDGHDLGEPHWQILEDGRLFFSVKRHEWSKKRRDKHIFHSPSIWSTALSGQWVMIATVYDLDRNEVRHALNGEVISREAIPEEYRVENVRIGAASICNWSEPVYRPDPEFAVRNLNGSLDEFALFGAALSEEEIRELYAKGRP